MYLLADYVDNTSYNQSDFNDSSQEDEHSTLLSVWCIIP